MNLRVILILMLSIALQAECLKILGVFHMPARSHYILGSRLMVELANRGHDVTVISPFGEKNPPKTYKDVILTGLIEEFQAHQRDMFANLHSNRFVMMFFMNFFGKKYSETLFAHENVQKLLKSNEQFDVVIVEQFFNDAHKAFCFHYNAPCVAFSTIGSSWWVNHLVGNPAPVSYIPDTFLNYSAKMNFLQRIQNTLVSLLTYLNRICFFMPMQNSVLHKYFPGAPHIDVLNNNISIVLLNSYVSTNQPVPHVPNMIEIGGFHISPPKALPKDLKEFLDGEKEGVVYFSMGSNLKSRELPKEKLNILLKVFSKLKQKVLWKWEDDVLPGQPPNVKLGKWLPQQDLLGHPNIKLFITHGGLLSTTETIYHGKPIVAIPVFGDQKMNAKNAVLNGFGLSIPFTELSEDNLSSAINEVLNNPKYSENAKTRSKIMHDRPLKPIDSAVYWVEYVVRHKGAVHFRSAALDLSWYQYYLIDVLLFLVGSVCSVIYIMYVILKKLFTRKKDNNDKRQSKKKSN